MGVFFLGGRYLAVARAQSLTLVLLVLGHVPWMRDVIAMLPHTGPVATFQRVIIFPIFHINNHVSSLIFKYAVCVAESAGNESQE